MQHVSRLAGSRAAGPRAKGESVLWQNVGRYALLHCCRKLQPQQAASHSNIKQEALV